MELSTRAVAVAWQLCLLSIGPRDELDGFRQRCGISLGHLGQLGYGLPRIVDRNVPAGGEGYVGRAYPDTARKFRSSAG